MPWTPDRKRLERYRRKLARTLFGQWERFEVQNGAYWDAFLGPRFPCKCEVCTSTASDWFEYIVRVFPVPVPVSVTV